METLFKDILDNLMTEDQRARYEVIKNEKLVQKKTSDNSEIELYTDLVRKIFDKD